MVRGRTFHSTLDVARWLATVVVGMGFRNAMFRLCAGG
jgi:hypothetical protein